MHRSTCSVIKDQIKLIFDSPPLRATLIKGNMLKKKKRSYLRRIGAALGGGGRGLAELL